MSKRVELLDVLKGMMIFFIIVTHFHFVYPDDYQRYGFYYWIDMAVPVFMIITGYLTAQSLEKRRVVSLKQAWASGVVVPRLIRFLIPFAFAMAVELPILKFVRKYNFFQTISAILRGGGAWFLLYSYND